jgi:hypothetical protein
LKALATKAATTNRCAAFGIRPNASTSPEHGEDGAALLLLGRLGRFAIAWGESGVFHGIIRLQICTALAVGVAKHFGGGGSRR